jgi:hypothetical protein
MDISRRALVGAITAAIVTGTSAGVGIGAAASGNATHHDAPSTVAGNGSFTSVALHHHKPTQHCPNKKGKYPPGKCRIYFTKHSYRHGDKVRFISGAVFKPHELVKVKLDCHPDVHHKGGVVAGRGGRARDHFSVPAHAHGDCVVTLHGSQSGITLSGDFHSGHRKHHH